MRDRLFALASIARRVIAPYWLAWHRDWGGSVPSPPSRYTCVRTSLLVVRLLDRHGIAGTLRSGVPGVADPRAAAASFGFRTTVGWESHAWVEAGGCILDITADQFGAAPVIVTPLPDPRYAAGFGSTALPPPGRNAIEAVEAAWQDWLRAEDFASFSAIVDS